MHGAYLFNDVSSSFWCRPSFRQHPAFEIYVCGVLFVCLFIDFACELIWDVFVNQKGFLCITSTLWLRKASVSTQMGNEANLCAEESWAVRTRNGGGSNSAFSKFPEQLTSCVSSGFTDFRSTFDNFTPLVSVLRQIFQAIRGDTERFRGNL